MLVAVDLGTSKTTAVIGNRSIDGTIHIAGVGRNYNTGIERGKISNIQDCTESIQEAINSAELLSGLKVKSCYVGISGNDISSVASSSMVTLSRNHMVYQADVKRAIEAAQTTAQKPPGTIVLHTIAHEFIIDNSTSTPIRDPLGMAATRLDTKIQMICCNENTLRNIETCFSRCNIELDGIVLNQIAESHSILSEDAKNNGVCLVKIGAGTTDIGVYLRGKLQYYDCLPIGGELATKDLLTVMDATMPQVEEIKKKHGCAKSSLTNDDEVIRFKPVSQQQVELEMQRSTLADIVEPRYTEIFYLAKKSLEKSQLEHQLHGGGIVITGGAAKIHGAAELACEIFRLPVSLGSPTGYESSGLSGSEDSTIIGLLAYAIAHNDTAQMHNKTKTTLIKKISQHLFNKSELNS